MKNIFLTMCILVSGLLAGCASIVTGHHQSVSVNTDPVQGAKCTLANNKGTWYVPSTPGSIIVDRSYENLNIVCQKQHYKGQKSVSSSTKAMAFGNIVFGGIIGGAVDVASGAAYDYPQEIHLPIARA